MPVWMRGASLLPLALAAALAAAACPPREADRLRAGGREFRVEVAADEAARARGLSGRDGLEAGSGMWFVLPEPGYHAFWMRGMRFPIDLVWVGGDFHVLGAVTLPVCRQDPCPSYLPPAPAAYVLELPAGSFRGRRGEQLHWTCRDARADTP